MSKLKPGCSVARSVNACVVCGIEDGISLYGRLTIAETAGIHTYLEWMGVEKPTDNLKELLTTCAESLNAKSKVSRDILVRYLGRSRA